MSAEQRAAPRRGAGPGPLREALVGGAHLAVLWAFAVAQPLFELLGDNPEFFAARGSTGFEIVSFSVLLVALPPALLTAVELALGLAGRRARAGAHLVLVALLASLVAAQPLKRTLAVPDPALVVLALAAGAAAAALYARARPVRSFVSVLSPAPVAFVGLFLFASPVSKLAFPDEAGARTIGGVTRAPIVMVLLDELPTATLMDRRGRIDPVRFPGFAELARGATWFRNAYTVYDSTERAQPAIMDGNYPKPDRLPISSDHPGSIFSLFAESHRLHVSEEATSVCSRDLCTDARLGESYGGRIGAMTEDLGLVWLHMVAPPELERELPSVSENWGGFGGEDGDPPEDEDYDSRRAGARVIANLSRNRPGRFRAWTAEIRAGRRPALHFKHALLPHVPWQYLPSGARYRPSSQDPVPGLSTEAYEDPLQRDVLLQRHVLQTQFTDLLLGRLWRRLKREGIWDDALIAVAADHGVALQAPRRRRRRLTRATVGEIASVPLLIKAPGQRRPRVDDSYVATVDILPTILDVLDLDPRVRMDGRSALGHEVRSRRTVRMVLRDTFEPLELPGAELVRQRREAVAHRLRVLGSGRDGRGRIYRVGPNRQLLGRRVEDLPAAPAGEVRADLVEAGAYRRVDPAGGFVPSHVVARVEGAPPGVARDVAIAVNGEIAAVSRSFRLAVGDEGELVSAMVPPWSLRPGRNRVEVLEVLPGGGLRRLGGT